MFGPLPAYLSLSDSDGPTDALVRDATRMAFGQSNGWKQISCGYGQMWEVEWSGEGGHYPNPTSRNGGHTSALHVNLMRDVGWVESADEMLRQNHKLLHVSAASCGPFRQYRKEAMYSGAHHA
eukprot:366336-Chlamydomonas_euryale.AAC.7